MSKISLERLYKELGYKFKEPGLLRLALTHRSVGKNNYERLEFLGDSILSFVISTKLYDQFPRIDEGRLSRLRASLVKGEYLAELARDLNLGDYLSLGPGELKSGGYRRDSILADAFEAVIGAIYLDSEIDTAQKFIEKIYENRLENLDLESATKDPKTRLQEYMQSRKMPLPEYDVIEIKGEAHNQSFTVKCKVVMFEKEFKAKGSSRRKAEQAVAANVLEEIKRG